MAEVKKYGDAPMDKKIKPRGTGAATKGNKFSVSDGVELKSKLWPSTLGW